MDSKLVEIFYVNFWHSLKIQACLQAELLIFSLCKLLAFYIYKWFGSMIKTERKSRNFMTANERSNVIMVIW